MNARSREVRLTRLGEGGRESVEDMAAVEDPMEIRLGDAPLAVTMRTPGDDEDLVRGFLLTEGILLSPEEITGIRRVDEGRVSVRLRPGLQIDPEQFRRNMFVSSSCGICGKASIEQVHLMAGPAPAFRVEVDVVQALTNELRKSQPTFDATGGLHAAGVYTIGGEPLSVREDVGRHNAVDKAIGGASLVSWPLPPSILVVSGRQSFEIVQKAAVVGIGGIVGVSAPSSLAIDLAQQIGMLLVGFSRGGACNVYSGVERLSGAGDEA